MLADNILFLREAYPAVYQAVKSWEESDPVSKALVEEAKDGNLTLKYGGDGQAIYVHSKYNPQREAQAIIDKLSEDQVINENSHVVFYGIGLAYHIEAFIVQYPQASYSIIEPSAEIFASYLDHKILKKSMGKNLMLLQCGNQAEALYAKAVQSKDKDLVICELPAYPQIFNAEYAAFLSEFKRIVKEQRSSLHTNFAYKKRWIVNSVNNFKVVLQTPNILLEDHDFCKGKSALLVAAGPSLDLEIDNLKKIKQEGLAYIFSVGSAINTLIHHGIEPDAICTYDPSERNQLVFNKINELEVDAIPMIFGSSVGYEVLEQYMGPKYHMITNQDTVAAYFLKPENGEPIEMVSDAPTIAVVTLELLVKLGFSQIILVGQNLAYTEEKSYSSGIDYITGEMRETMLQADGVFTESVAGKQVKTSESFLSMKRQLEHMISKYQAKVVNTTFGGASIEGTSFIPLARLISEELTKAVVFEHPLNQVVMTKKYNKTYALAQLEQLKTSYQEYQSLVSGIKSCLLELHDLTRRNREKEAHQTHLKMDIQIKAMEDNDFFNMIALPINRVEYGILFNAIQKTKAEKNHLRKAKSVIKPTETFIDLLYTDMNLNNEIMLVFDNVIREFA
ncbi:motility associated factor glycosyltransferase family protein [Acetobacterium wieringae]|nr:6-hydroxymethylpterin diphosphokinase MptE-like protein [Acetobacterium wieringae]